MPNRFTMAPAWILGEASTLMSGVRYVRARSTFQIIKFTNDGCVVKRSTEWLAVLVAFKNGAELCWDVAGVGVGQVESVNDLVNKMGLCKFKASIFVSLDIDS